MSSLKPNQDVDARGPERAIDRFTFCRRMLYLHGFLTEVESRKVEQRIVQWMTKADLKAAEVQP